MSTPLATPAAPVVASPPPPRLCIDGNEAVARVAYRLTDVIALFPITPSTPMGEQAEGWQAKGRPNLWGVVPTVVALQSEAGVAGAVHGALQAGSLATTFTASQGLLLMLPNLYRWAGQLLPAVVHVACRAIAAQALSIFGDHGDAMACRSSGCAIVCGTSVQEAGDLAAITTRAALQARLPVLHLLDGFRTSHELQAVQPLPDAVLHHLMPMERLADHRRRALSPDHPVIRGTAQDPDVAFQARETVNPFVAAFPGWLEEAMACFAGHTGRTYAPYSYQGSPEAERVLVLMGSAVQTAEETVRWLRDQGEAVGVLTVRLFRPFCPQRFCRALPAHVRRLAVLDRCKEPGAPGEPLYLDVLAALAEAWTAVHGPMPLPLVRGGRYGLASKEFTPAMVLAVFRALARPDPPNHFTVGIVDDVGHTSLPLAETLHLEPADQGRAVFYGLGSDGSVGAARSTARILAEATSLHVQAYVVHDSRKAGSVTVSHLRYGPAPIRAPYLVQRPTLLACHHWDLLERLDLLAAVVPGGALLLNSPWDGAETWRHLPESQRATIRTAGLQVWWIDATAIARAAGLGPRINTVLQVAFFAVSGVLPMAEALERIEAALQHRYGARGEEVVTRNRQALQATLARLHPLDWAALDRADPPGPPSLAPDEASVQQELAQPGTGGAADPFASAPPFVQEVTATLLRRQGNSLPVSALPCDGTWPVGSARWEHRSMAEAVPVWTPDLCVQCNLCALVCPHAAIRAKVVDTTALNEAPPGFQHVPARDRAFAAQRYTLQVAVEDCTGCGLCLAVCPGRDREEPTRLALTMAPQRPQREQGRRHWAFFLALPEQPRTALLPQRISQQQLQEPLFTCSGACAGCGETPYLKLASQLFGERMLVANATGCSSIYGGNLPTTPWSSSKTGRGPAWCNSLFEDNAEFGYGLRLAVDQQRQEARQILALLAGLAPVVVQPDALCDRTAVAAHAADLCVLSSDATHSGSMASVAPEPIAPEPVISEPAAPGRAAVEAAAAAAPVPAALALALLHADQQGEAAIAAQRQRVAELKDLLRGVLLSQPQAAAAASPAGRLLQLADALVARSIWLVGGDGWAYDIGFGGLDHVLAADRDLNVLVLDTEVYSNTGGQRSKATPLGAVAPFASAGKASAKKDLGLMAMTYGHVYVASVALGARPDHTLKVFLEAESYPGPALILAYAPCIAHGYPMAEAIARQRSAVASGRWFLYRFDPRRAQRGEPPLQLDMAAPHLSMAEAMAPEQRFAQLRRRDPHRAAQLTRRAQGAVQQRWALFSALARGVPLTGAAAPAGSDTSA